MKNNILIKKLNLFQFWKIIHLAYSKGILPFIDGKVLSMYNDLFNYLNPIVEWSLVDRFTPSKKRKRYKKISSDMRLLLIRTGVITIPDKRKPPSPMDIVKYFKLLENFILTRVDRRSEIDSLKLSYFRAEAMKAYDTLPKLLLEIDNMQNAEVRRKIFTSIFSLACVYRHFKVTALHDHSTITNPYTGRKSLDALILSEFSKERISAWTKTLKIKEMKKFLKLIMYSGNASSPNGGASGVNILKDVAAIAKESRLVNAVRSISSHFEGAKEFLYLFDTLLLNVSIDPDYAKDTEHSRLVTFTAPGGKSRIIAVTDWISQTALSAVHFSLFKLLSTIPSDVTFNHPKGLELYTDPSSKYYSVDLSAATDRMPRLLQSRVLASIYSDLGLDGESIAKNWLELMARDFSTRGSAFETKAEKLTYAVGQPMGEFSSWTCLAITHHYIVNGICGIPMEDYRLVGDDLLIKGNPDKFNLYLDICDAIGIKINLAKTIVSNDTVEFARNYIIKGERVKPIPIGVAFSFLRETTSFENVVKSLAEHLSPEEIMNIYLAIPGYSKISRTLNIIYFFFKEKANIDINELLKKFKLTRLFSVELFQHISDITKGETTKTWHLKELGDFYSTLKSTCVMRKDDELTRACILAESLQLLGFADESLVDAANNMFRRLTSANLITYEIDVSYGPLLSRRERNLLKDILYGREGVAQDDSS